MKYIILRLFCSYRKLVGCVCMYIHAYLRSAVDLNIHMYLILYRFNISRVSIKAVRGAIRCYGQKDLNRCSIIPRAR